MTLTKEEELMREDYRASLELLCHEDDRKAHLFTTFFLIQGAVFGFYTWAAAGNKVLATILAVFAMVFCAFWFLVMERMRAFIELRYCQLEQLETKLGVLTTITNETRLRSTGRVQVMDRLYSLSAHQKLFSISKTVESLLPVLVGLVWLLIVVGVILGLF